jgi:antitoxin component YwqK of YwqJK toxin-antitoxin module
MIRIPSGELEYDFKEDRHLRNGEPFTGTTYDVHPNGVLAAESEFRHGLLWGVARDWYLNGAPEAEYEFRYGLLWGGTRAWYSNGRLSYEGHFLRDVKHGIAQAWDKEGRLKEESYCEYGIVIYEKKWNEEGVLVHDHQLKEGDSDYESLQRCREVYSKEEPEGAGASSSEFQWSRKANLIRVPSGEIEYDFKQGIYLRGGEPFTGVAFGLYPYGSLEAESEFRDGLSWGVGRSWRPNGQLSSEAYFMRDVRHGIAREWDEEGRLEEESYCEYGIVIYEKKWNEEGVLVHDYQLKEGDSDYESLQFHRKVYGKGRDRPRYVSE